MKKEILNYIKSNKLSPFNKNKSSVSTSQDGAYKTKDAKAVHTKLLSTLSTKFNFADTGNLFNVFSFSEQINTIKERQDFFKGIKKSDSNFLKKITMPKKWWNPKYGVLVVTEDDKTFNELQKLGCPTKFLITQSDLDSLDDYDIVQVVDCENFERALEHLPQAVFLDSIDDVYLERYVQLLSAWQNNLNILKENPVDVEINSIIEDIWELTNLLNDNSSIIIKRDIVEDKLLSINKDISSEIKGLTVSGESLFTILSGNTIPPELMEIIQRAISKSNMPSNLYTRTIPVEINEENLAEMINSQSIKEHTSLSHKIKKSAEKLKSLPKKLDQIADLLILYDFTSGISEFISDSTNFPEQSNTFNIKESSNLFIKNAQAISFYLNEEERCSILTGANSGGKTTLLEHIIQINSLYQLGLPISGNIKLPLFSEVYYFAKNKGSLNKGAFETLLLQMSQIKPGRKTLILADEIESVTEPGVAGAIVCATADYFIRQGCFLVIATHLGKEIQKNLPTGARVDGIEAKGLDENYELIVDHNPVIGRLANSTPELIIEKMVNSYKTDYFNHLHESLKSKL